MIHKERLKECIDILSLVLKQSGDETVMVGEREWNRIELVNFTSKWLYKMMIDDTEVTEDYLLYLVESIHYSMGMTNEPPKLNVVTADELEKIHSKYLGEPKFKVTT